MELDLVYPSHRIHLLGVVVLPVPHVAVGPRRFVFYLAPENTSPSVQGKTALSS